MCTEFKIKIRIHYPTIKLLVEPLVGSLVPTIRNKTLEKTTTNLAYYRQREFSKMCRNFILIKFSPNCVLIGMLGSLVIILLVYLHTGNYALGLVLDPYVALDENPVGNYFFFIF